MGNMTHDLKTVRLLLFMMPYITICLFIACQYSYVYTYVCIQPIAGIVSALEYLECAAAEAFELLKGDSVDLKKVADSFRSSIDAARTIRSITSFMLSTVNRCLDFTKVGVPFLTPRLYLT